ncbi:PEPxxWA-CTERM sorting domain-containing protein [Sphingomonas sp. GB1N7]|uniref:PEPxxWA-CTERM sorting domain-containing protein n=1 Tax=Parasphingomonas caseinilytica TaxID=3096158 RepID=UPI002FC71AF0
MKKYILAGIAAIGMTTGANAANLISASVNGPSGTVWNTNSADTFYTLFLVRPFGNVINPTDNFTSSATTLGSNNYSIAGDGFPGGTSTNSDPFYTLTLIFADGATISGQYVGSTFTGGTSATAGGVTYTLTGFGWDRSPADNVSAFRAVSGGDPSDYTGQFSFSQVAAAVPEPATWGLMLTGFGMVGFGMRRRAKVSTTVTYA